jgi:hypothetical protein
VSLATRWLVDDVLNHHFLEGIVRKFVKSDSRRDWFRAAMDSDSDSVFSSENVEKTKANIENFEDLEDRSS